MKSGESVSIGTQRSILADCCENHGYAIYKAYTQCRQNRSSIRKAIEETGMKVFTIGIPDKFLDTK